MAGINIPFLSDVRDFLRGGDSVADKLDDVADSLDEVGESGKDAGREATRALDDVVDKLDDVADASRDTGRALDDSADGAGQAADKIEREFTDALDKVRAAGKATGKSVGDDLDAGAKEAGEGIGNLKDEADGTAREVAASFDGSAESIAEGFQEVAANALSGFGPAGAAAGLAAAAGIGIAIAKLTEYAEQVNAAKEAGAEWATSFNTAGLNDRISALHDSWRELGSTITDSREWYEISQESAVTAIEDIALAARRGLPGVQEFIDSFDTTDPARRLEQLQSALDDLSATGGSAGEHWRAVLGGPEAEQAYLDRIEGIKELEEVIQGQIEIQQQANEIEAAHAEALGVTVEQYRAQQEAIAASTEAQEAYAQALEDTADPVSTYRGILSEKEDAERATAEATAAATSDATDSWEDYAKGVEVSTDDLIDAWNRQAEQARDFEKNLATIAADGGQALADELRAKGPEVAGSVADVIAEAGPAKRRKAIEAHARATGDDISTDMATGIRRGRTKIKDAVDDAVSRVRAPEVPVPFRVDTYAADTAIARWRARIQSQPLSVGVRAV